MKKILVPTDFSAPAGHATELALRLALKHGASIHLVHSVDVPETWKEGRFTSAKLALKPPREQQALYPETRAKVGAARQALEKITMDMSKKKVTVTYEVASNAAWKDITKLAKDMDLIVMGTHGAGALREALIGSNTQRVVRLATRPVLTLHHAAPARFANVALLVDPTERDMEKHLHRLIAPLQGPRTRFHLVHVNTPGRFQDTGTSLELLGALAKRMEPTVTLNVCDHFSVAEGAIDFARRGGMDAIALITHGRTGLRGVLNTSVAETVVNHSAVPVLTLRID